MVHWILGRVESAIADYSTCLRLDPANALARTNRGAAYADKGDLTAAHDDFTRALELDPLRTPAVPEARRRVRSQRRTRSGHRRLHASHPPQPLLRLSCVKRGDAYRGKGQYDRASADYSSALRLDPLHIAGYLNRAATYRLRGQSEMALVDLSQALRLDPNTSRIWFEGASLTAL